jgi:hypothetical protein
VVSVVVMHSTKLVELLRESGSALDELVKEAGPSW